MKSRVNRLFLLHQIVCLILLGVSLLASFPLAIAHSFSQAMQYHFSQFEVHPQLANAEIPSLGLELEGGIPENFGRVRLAKSIEQGLLILHPHIHHSRKEYGDFLIKLFYGYDGGTRELKVALEEFPSPEGYLSTEVITGIMGSPSDREVDLRNIVKTVQSSGFQILPHHAGVHVHVGLAGITTHEIMILTRVMAALERQLGQIFSTSPFRRRYCKLGAFARFNQALDRLELTSPALSLETLMDNFMPRDRNTPFNPQSFLGLRRSNCPDRSCGHGTGEFRFFNSTLDYDHLHLMMDFCWKLVTGIRTKNQRLMELLLADGNALDAWEVARALNMKISPENPALQGLADEATASILNQGPLPTAGNSTPILDSPLRFAWKQALPFSEHWREPRWDLTPQYRRLFADFASRNLNGDPCSNSLDSPTLHDENLEESREE